MEHQLQSNRVAIKTPSSETQRLLVRAREGNVGTTKGKIGKKKLEKIFISYFFFFFFFLVSLATLLSNQNLKSKLIVTRSHTLSRALPQVCTCICTEFKVAYSRVGSLVLVYLTQLKTALRTKPKPTKNYHAL